MPSVEGVQVWQYGGETNYIRSNKIAGVVCDQDYSYVDFPSLIKAKGLNGYKPPSSTSAPAASSAAKPATSAAASKKTVEQLADEVIAGKWGVGADREKRLTAAGHDYKAVQTRVNEKMAVKTEKTKITPGDRVKVASNAVVYGMNLRWQAWVYSSEFYVASLDGSRAVISVDKAGNLVTGAIDVKYLIKI
jgi:hypothetical protein